MWYYAFQQKQQGPVSGEELLRMYERGELSGETVVWKQGLAGWEPLARHLADLVGNDVATDTGTTPSAPSVIEEEMVLCVYSGVLKPASQMVRYGDQWLDPTQKEAFLEHLELAGHSVAQPTIQSQAELTLTGVFGRAFRLLGRNTWILLAVCVSFYLPMGLAEARLSEWLFGSSDDMTLKEFGKSVRFSMMMSIFLGTLGMGSIIYILNESWHGRHLDYGAAMIAGFKYYLSLVWIAVLAYMGTVLMTLLLIIPGVFVFVRWSLASYVRVLEGRRGSLAITRSYKLTSGHFWRLCGYGLLAFIPMAGGMFVFGLLFGVSSALFEVDVLEHWVADGMLNFIFQIFALPGQAVLFVVAKELSLRAPVESM